MFWLPCGGWHLRFETFRYINTMILHFLVSKVGEHKIRRIRGIEKMKRIRKVERIEEVREIEEAITKIR